MPIIDPFAQEVSKPREIVDPFKLQKIVDPFAQAEAQPEAPQKKAGFSGKQLTFRLVLQRVLLVV